MLKPCELFMLLVYKVKDTPLLPALSSVTLEGLLSLILPIVEAEKKILKLSTLSFKDNYLDIFRGSTLSNYTVIVPNKNSFLCLILFSVSASFLLTYYIFYLLTTNLADVFYKVQTK